MEILFRPIQHDSMEVIMGQVIWFTPINGIDGISATANTEGFTPLSSITTAYNWDRNLIRQATQKCNAKSQIVIVEQVKPTLFLVPKTKGNSDTEFLIKDLISAINEMQIENLHFTHYSFIQNKLPKNEINQIFQTFEKNIQNSLKKVIWDVDRRHKESLIKLNTSCKSIN
jgi:hypothetical protein